MHHRGTLELFHYWTQQRVGRAAPKRADIAPAAISTLLGNTFILEGSAKQPRFRLAGTRLCAAFGRELRGLSLADVFDPHDRNLIAKALSAVASGGDLVVGEVAADDGEGGKICMELLLLPLSDDNTRILGSLQFLDNPFWLGSRPLGTMQLMTLKHADPDQELVSLSNRPPMMLPTHRNGDARARIWHVLEGGKSEADLKDRNQRQFSVIHGGRND
ncbi:MAG: PAS domain-containing protein [Pseudomonadota bacterium]